MSNPAPPLIVSSLDLARLEARLESPAHRDQPASRALLEELLRAEVRPPEQMPPDVVTMNSTVTCIDEIDGTSHQFTLVYPDAADVDAGRVSVLAPVGSALLGLRVGQSIDWVAPTGRKLRIRATAIHYQPEAAGDYTR